MVTINRTTKVEVSEKMYVINRKGVKQDVCFDKILRRVQLLSYGLHSLVDPPAIAQAVINGVSAYFPIASCCPLIHIPSVQKFLLRCFLG